jgi:DNA-binding beta-propeller fold protein YncE
MHGRMRTEVFLVLAALTACGTSGGKTGDPTACPDMTSTGASTIAGVGEAGFVDGDRCTARFHNPVNVAYGADGKLYVADFDNGKIRSVDSSGKTDTIVAKQGFARPFAVVFGPDGALYAATDNDPNNQHGVMSGTIWKIDIHAKSATPLAVDIGRPRGLFFLKDGRLVATDYENHVVEAIDTATGHVTNLAGTFGQAGFADGAGATARFSAPYGIVQLSDGRLVVADWGNQRIRIVTLDGTVSTMGGGGAGFADGAMADAKFNHPQGLAIDKSDNIYITDIDNFRIRKISGSTVSTVAGDGMDGYADDMDPQGAEFHGLEGLAVKPDGSAIYVADGTRGEDVPFNRIRIVVQ